jgi:hypothetical protein
MHSWMVDAFTVSPRLAVYSPTKGCGKTTLLGAVSKMVKRPKFTGSISPAALFRLVETFQPTLLIDELKKFLELGSELHGILNEGHGRGVHVLRVLGEKKELREFRVFGAVAFGTLGRVPDDLEDRSIVVRLQRRRADEDVCEFRLDRAENLEQLARWCARWADDNARLIEDLDPDVPGLMNRAADNWRPLFAIAACIGGDWPARVQEAAAALADYDDESAITMLLIDIKAMFGETGTDRLASATICDKLATIDGRPWADWRNGKPITTNQLARLLKPFGVASDTIRMAGGAAKGYWRHVFSDAFDRYFPETPPCEPLHRNKCDEIRISCTSQSVTAEPDVTSLKFQKPNNHGDCYGVTLCEEGHGPDEHLCAHCKNPACEGAPLLDAFDAGTEVRLHEECLPEYMKNGIPDFLRRIPRRA